jgi:hypothetical protein
MIFGYVYLSKKEKLIERIHVTYLLNFGDNDAVLVCHTVPSFWWLGGQAFLWNTWPQKKPELHVYLYGLFT